MKKHDFTSQRKKLFVVFVVFLAASSGLWLWIGTSALALLLPVAVLIVLAAQLTMWRHLDRDVRRLRNDTIKQTQALQSIHTLLPVRFPLPAMTKYAIDPDFAELLIATVFEHRPRCVLELGSGVSTLIVAYALKAIGDGRIVSVDESEQYTRLTQRNIMRHGLEDVARVIHAPLVPTDVESESYRWYDQAGFGDLAAIDLLIVDGPSGRTGPSARYPAAPLLWSRLNERALIILDDADRKDERQIVKKWRQRFDALREEHVATRKGAFVLHRAAA